MPATVESLELFHPLIKRWFLEQVGTPTDVQEQAWPVIADGDHVLVTAPTGSGKTLTAFLWALNQLVTGTWETGFARVLYISPLKALNNDIRRNLLTPLRELEKVFEEAGEPFPRIRVQTRSGDTSQSDRRKMLRHPPEILITTPESLNLMLSSLSGRSLLTGLNSVILDEIHGVFSSRRGTYLISAVDRLTQLCGEFQRIALSATIRPMETVAAFVGGYTRVGDVLEPRPVTQIESRIRKEYRLTVTFPEINHEDQDGDDDSVWEPLVEEFKGIIERNRSTLFFVNNRRLCEKLALKINLDQARPLAYAHHGSLSREIREEVEAKLKAGELRAIIATNTLEMGIDIGSLDEVVLVQSPPAVSSAIQRIGRAGHQVGLASKGVLFPTHSRDFLEAAVLARHIELRDIEPLRPIDKPLDVLAQVIISMVGLERWNLDRLHAFLQTTYPYRNLGRTEFDLVIEMLAGRYADTRLRELKPRISVDRIDGTARARKGALQALYLSGGVIPDRGTFHLRHDESNARLGDLDEEFVWEARVGQVFTLGAQSWKIRKITQSDVFVVPASPNAPSIPFWIAEDNYRDFHFSDAIGRFLERADRELDDESFADSLTTEHAMNAVSAEQLVAFLRNQKKVTRQSLPHRHHILVEFASSGPETAEGHQVILHTLWGGKLNRPFALALDAAWEERFHHRLEAFVNNDCIALMVPIEVSAAEILTLVTSTRLEALIRMRLEGSGFFGARFRECAGRAMLVTRSRPNQRIPLWMTRLRSQKLMESVRTFEDFPILLETWRTCFRDEFDLDSLKEVLGELEAGAIHYSEARTSSASPFAQSAAWRQVNQYMYSRDDPKADRRSNLNTDLLKEVVFDQANRPAIPKEVVDGFLQKRRRLAEGYGPSDSDEMLDWIVERIFLPEAEVQQLTASKEETPDETTPEDWLEPIQSKIIRIKPVWSDETLVVAAENAGGLKPFFGEAPFALIQTDESPVSLADWVERGPEVEPASWFGTWLTFSGPVSRQDIQQSLGLAESAIDSLLDDLIDAEEVIEGILIEGVEEVLVCDATNYEFLLRLKRARATPPFEPRPLVDLVPFLALEQGLIGRSEDLTGFTECLDRLLLLPALAGLWESEIFPARMARYQPPFLDSLMQEGEILWFGLEGQKSCFAYHQDLDLWPVPTESESDPDEGDGVDTALPTPKSGRLDFVEMRERSGLNSEELHQVIWDAVWKTEITNDGFMALRKGILNRFELPKGAPSSPRPRHRRPVRSGRGQDRRMQGALPVAGRWHHLDLSTTEDLIDAEETRKDRVRLLLDRYGILFRELLGREAEGFQWRTLFRTLRLMELSGELYSGYFFEDIPGPQFISPAAFRRLQQLDPAEVGIFWLCAQDPISPCGLPLESLKGGLPRRVGSNHLVYRGSDCILISQRLGKDIEIRIKPDDDDLVSALSVFEHLLNRQFQPLNRITIESINGEPASHSDYLESFRARFDVVPDVRHVRLYRKYT